MNDYGLFKLVIYIFFLPAVMLVYFLAKDEYRNLYIVGSEFNLISMTIVRECNNIGGDT